MERIRTLKGLRSLALLVLASASAASFAQAALPAEEPATVAQAPKNSKFTSAEDGWLDLSTLIDQQYGFLPVVIPITEPAVGLGAAGALVFIDKPQRDAGSGFGRPNISVVGALGTENGSRGAFAADMRYWMGDRLQTLVGAIKTTVNLDFYGSGEQGFLNQQPISYALDISGGLAQAKYRIGESRNWLGLGYVLADTKASPDFSAALPDRDKTIRIGGVTAAITHDSRDNIFTPRSGNYLDLSAAVFNEALGSDLDFKRLSLTGMQYLPLDAKWFLALRESLARNYGNAPFYMQPFVMMRGVPAMRYQGETVGQVEAEVRWQFWQRFSAVGFVGAGSAVDEFRQLTRSNNVVAGGAGLRYEIARKYGLHMGLDVAWSRDGPAVYVQFGSAWMRP